MTAIPYARRVWHLLETLHAVTYFADECREANRTAGLRGFWMGYFGARAAPLGPVHAAVVTATFANFHPQMVARSLPDAWSYASPEHVLATRSEAAAAALRRIVPDVEVAAARSVPLLSRVVEAGVVAGRPLFAANRAVPPPDDPVAALWQAATALREHRGDGHVACLLTADLGGCDSHVMFAMGEGVPPALFRDSRGWTDDDWTDATARLEARGLVAEGRLTAEGDHLRAGIEARTDVLADAPYGVLTHAQRDELLAVLGRPARTVARSGVIPFPNPMGLPPTVS